MVLEVENVLRDKAISYRLIPLKQNAFTVDDVITYSEEAVDPDEICKTIIVRGKKSNKKMAILLKGRDKLDFSKAKKLFGEEMTIATGEQVKEASGVEPGAVCPFLLRVPLYVDKQVESLERINCGSGHHLFGLEFMRKDLEKGTQYGRGDFSKISKDIY